MTLDPGTAPMKSTLEGLLVWLVNQRIVAIEPVPLNQFCATNLDSDFWRWEKWWKMSHFNPKLKYLHFGATFGKNWASFSPTSVRIAFAWIILFLNLILLPSRCCWSGSPRRRGEGLNPDDPGAPVRRQEHKLDAPCRGVSWRKGYREVGKPSNCDASIIWLPLLFKFGV